MADVCIINASYYSHNPNIPMGPLILVKNLKKNGYSVNFIDYQNFSDNDIGTTKHFKSIIENCNAKFIGISVFSNSLPLVINAIKHYKCNNDNFVFLGGPGVAGIEKELLNISPIDAIVSGEGEETVVELISALNKSNDLKDIKGIIYKSSNGKITVNTPRPILKIPDYYPDYSCIDLKEYNNKAIIITSRGCPFKCTFCSKPIWKDKVTYRTMDNVFEELRILKKLKVEKLHICDDTFIYNKERVFEFCERYIKEDINIPWECTGRIGLMDEKLLEILKNAGCSALFLGIESSSDTILNYFNKKINNKLISEQLKLVKKYISMMYTSYIWGHPEETLEDFIDTYMSYVYDSSQPNMRSSITLATPFLDTKLYEDYKNYLMYLENNTYNGSSIHTNTRKDKEIMDMIKENASMFPSFYYLDNKDFKEKLNYIKLFKKTG